MRKCFLSTLLYQALIAEGRIIEEGDIAVTDDSTPLSGNTMNAFLVDKDKLWMYGRVSYRFEKRPLQDGTFEPWFSEVDENMIREAMRQIHQQVPCIKFRFEKNKPSVFYYYFVLLNMLAKWEMVLLGPISSSPLRGGRNAIPLLECRRLVRK